jgi:hypothetical protein
MPNRLALATLLATLPFASPSLAADPFGLQDSESSSVSRIMDGGLDLTVKTVRKTRTLDDGTVETKETVELNATLDGKPVPQERIRRSGERVEILDEKGQVVRTALVGFGGGTSSVSVPAPGSEPGSSPVGSPPARPMLGVTLEEPGEPLVKQLRLAPGRTTLLTSIVPESPAAKAGLETYDVIVGIAGRDDASPDAIRAFLAGAKVGDAVTLAVIRGGERRELPVTLEAMTDAMAARLGGGEGIDPEIREILEQLRARGIDIDLDMLGVPGGGMILAPNAIGPGGGSMRFMMPGGAIRMGPGAPDFEAMERRMREMQLEMERRMQELERQRSAPPAPAAPPAPTGREA